MHIGGQLIDGVAVLIQLTGFWKMAQPLLDTDDPPEYLQWDDMESGLESEDHVVREDSFCDAVPHTQVRLSTRPKLLRCYVGYGSPKYQTDLHSLTLPNRQQTLLL